MISFLKNYRNRVELTKFSIYEDDSSNNTAIYLQLEYRDIGLKVWCDCFLDGDNLKLSTKDNVMVCTDGAVNCNKYLHSLDKDISDYILSLIDNAPKIQHIGGLR